MEPTDDTGTTTPDTVEAAQSLGSLFSHTRDDSPPAAVDDVPEASSQVTPAAGGFGLLFKAPDLSEVPARPRRRRAQEAEDPGAGPGGGEGDGAGDDDRGPDGDQGRGDQRHHRPEGADGEQGGTDGTDGTDGTEGPDGTEDDEDRGRRRRRRGGKGRRTRGAGAGEERAADGGDGSGAVDGQDEGEDEDQGDGGRPETDPTSTTSRSGRSRSGRGSRGSGGPGSQPEQGPAEDPAEEGNGGSKRRRRRRRSGEEPDRPVRDEVSGVKGSTRLEAKRQRRREGREAGRRRTIITEAEFLARRESVERVMVVRGLEDRTQIGVLEDGVLVEHYVSRETQTTMVGNVYLGRVQNVLPSMEAAFVDIGKGRNAVLYAGEVNWDAAGLDREPKRIENALKAGESVLVQVTKDPIGHKGARLTSQVSLPGRYLVYVPRNSMTGISRKLPDTERARLKKILKEVVPADAGVIVRTAAEGASEAELRADVERLTAMWERINSKQQGVSAPALLHGEPDMTVRVIRDVFNEDFTKLVVAGDKAWEEVSGYVGSVAPDLADRVERWTGAEDVFTHHRVTEALAKAMDRKVWLPSGGSLVIDRTEAMTVVDVNTGKFVGSGGNLEETVTKNNIEAAEEIVRQLRLRDIGGIIVIDFIDMVLESNRELVVRRLLECLGRDRTKHQVAEVTSLGLIQMTRKRVGSGLIEVFSEPCAHCGGRGIVVHPEPVERPSGGEAGNGGGNGSGRGGRSRKGRSAGNGSGEGAEGRMVLPTPNPKGPTPAQIAAAAHAAALQAGSVSEAADAASLVVEQETRLDQESTPGGGTTPEPVAPEPTTEPAPAEPGPVTPATAPEPSAPEPSAPEPSAPEPATSPVEAAAARPRRRRGRVVAPAGPPAGLGEGDGG